MPVKPRFGELLSQLVALSGHDVEEILHEQGSTQQRFGEIALAWGLCRPEHVWNAWCNQLAERGEKVDLKRVAIDHKAVECLPPQVARRHKLMPIRLINDHLILAVSDLSISRMVSELAAELGKKLRFVLADEVQLSEAISMHYPSLFE